MIETLATPSSSVIRSLRSQRIALLLVLLALMCAWSSRANSPSETFYSDYLSLAKETQGKLDDRHYALLTKAAEAGHQLAQGALGFYLAMERGRTDPEVMKTAVSWLKKVEAVDKPELDGPIFVLALCYCNGSGTGLDIERGGKLLQRIAPRGSEDVKMAYGCYLIAVKGDPAEARRYLNEVIRDTKNPATRSEAEEQLKTLR